jgi:NAD(P)H-hydrate epimerase
VIEDLARNSDPLRVIAVDLPSGLASDSGNPHWVSVIAGTTVTFAAPKHGHVLSPSCERVGVLTVADIGVPRALLQPAAPGLWLLEREDARAAFPRRTSGGHKGTYGHLLILAGSVGKTGAAILAATAALRTGAGLVTVATAEPAAPLVAGGRPEVMTESLPVGADGGLTPEAVARALFLAETRDAVVLGPGLGQEAGTREFVREIVARCPVPLVVDAEGLNALASQPDAASHLRRPAATLLTPHPGEMARLIGVTTRLVQEQRLETARAFSTSSGAVVVLKGFRTVVAEPSGRAAVNPTGNPGMATGGSGDVLAGMLGALLARGLDPWIAATAGVFMHGLAGDCAAKRLGEECLLAGDVIEALPEALRELRTPSESRRGRHLEGGAPSSTE